MSPPEVLCLFFSERNTPHKPLLYFSFYSQPLPLLTVHTSLTDLPFLSSITVYKSGTVPVHVSISV